MRHKRSPLKTSITSLPPKWVTASSKVVLTFGSVNETFLAALCHCAMVLFASQHFTMSLLWFKSPSLQIYRVSDYMCLCVIYQQIDTLAAFRMILHLFILQSAGVLVARGRGLLPYMGYIGTCRGIGYGFWGSRSLNRVSFFTLLFPCPWCGP